MEAGTMADAFGSLPGHDLQQADAEQACIQAVLEGEETWAFLPPEAYMGTVHEKKFDRADGSIITQGPASDSRRHYMATQMLDHVARDAATHELQSAVSKRFRIGFHVITIQS